MKERNNSIITIPLIGLYGIMINNKVTVTGYRNDYIDFLRGLAAISIVAIHTAFWSGESYTPTWFKSMTLLVDVPFFFYLSGWSTSYKQFDFIKTGKGLLNIWKKWLFFVTLVALFCYLSSYSPFSFQGVKDIKDLVNNWLCHNKWLIFDEK